MDAAQYADIFARAAATGNHDELVKVAAAFQKEALLSPEASAKLQSFFANPATQNALIGAGAGGLLGLVQPRRKLRNALQMALLGGGMGLGYSALMGQLGGGAKAPEAGAAPAAANAAAPGAAAAGAEQTTAGPAQLPADLTDAQRRALAAGGEGNAPLAAGLGAAAGGGLLYRGSKNMADAAANRLGRFSGEQLRTYAASGGTDADAIKLLNQRLGPGPNREARIKALIDDVAQRGLPAGAKYTGPSAQLDRRMRREIGKVTRVLDRGRIETTPLFRQLEAGRLARMANTIDPKITVNPRGLAADLRRVARPSTMSRRTLLPTLLRTGLGLAGGTAGAIGGAYANQQMNLGNLLPAGGAQPK